MSVLPPTLRFKGELSADEDLLIQGTVEGTIHHTQRVTMGEEGKVKANISAQVIKVEGTSKAICTPTVGVRRGVRQPARQHPRARRCAWSRARASTVPIEMDLKKAAPQAPRSDASCARTRTRQGWHECTDAPAIRYRHMNWRSLNAQIRT